MQQTEYRFPYEVYGSLTELPEQDAVLLQQARQVTATAYAPYSRFRVGAVARLANGEIVTGSNQENASYPAGICAERVLMSVAAARFPEVPIETLAVSYHNEQGKSDHPVSPCGICRQSLQEFEGRVGQPIRLVLSGMEGKVFVIPQSGYLLPLAFTGEALQ